MPPVEEEEQGVFEQDDELDDSEGDDSDMEDDLDDDEEEYPDMSPPPPHSQPSFLPKEESNSPTTFLNPNPNNAATPTRIAPQNGSIKAVPVSASDGFTPPAHIVSAAEESRRVAAAASADESRRLFQRLWTDEDEITILQGFLEFTTQRGTTHASHQYDTGPFYEQIKKQLQLEFSKNQLIEKLRRLKKKYRNVVNRMVSGKEFAFKSGHEQATFEISRKIWSASIKRSRDSEDDDFTPLHTSAIVEFDSGFGVGAIAADGSLSSEKKLSRSSKRRIRIRSSEQEAAAAAAAAAAEAAGVAVEVPIAAPPDPPLSAPIPSIIEETVKSCLSPLFKELLQSAMAGPQGGLIPGIGGIGGGLLGINPLQLGIGNFQGNLPIDEKWRNQNILELEVYLKRIELMRDQIKLTLEELKSSTPPAGD